MLNCMINKALTHIHFVCTGNIYRSRLAEAYLKSKNIPGLVVSSSGTHASEQYKWHISWYALRLHYRYGLINFLTPTWTNTISKHVVNSDIVIFMGNDNYEYCIKKFAPPKKYEIWNLPDFDDVGLNGKPLDLTKESEYIQISENVFAHIREKVDHLVMGMDKL